MLVIQENGLSVILINFSSNWCAAVKDLSNVFQYFKWCGFVTNLSNIIVYSS